MSPTRRSFLQGAAAAAAAGWAARLPAGAHAQPQAGGAGDGWLAGDLHVHTTYSHDVWAGPGDDNTGAEDFFTLGWSVADRFAQAFLGLMGISGPVRFVDAGDGSRAAVALVVLGASVLLVAVLVGLVVFTTGFFGAHSVASGWVAGRAAVNKSHASALYLMAYYTGSSVGGTAIGLAWSAGGWPATVAAVAGCFVAGALVAAGVREPTG